MTLRQAMLPVAQINARLRARRWRGVRFLCYHSVVDEPDLTPLSQLTPVISTGGFRRHLELTRSSGYSVVSMAEALRLMESGQGQKGQYVCFTFDDGRLDNFACAWPMLQQFGFSAHFFVSSGLVGTSEPSGRNGYIDRYMSVLQMRTMIAEGASVGSHGCSHRDLTTLDLESISQELVGSRRELETLLGVPVTSYAYAYARYDRRVLRATRSAGYTHAFTINTGAVTSTDDENRFTIMRNPMRSGVNNPENYAMIQGGFDFTRIYSDLKLRVKY
jgi:peptidoglycan/xylan/chitin deacetylase (PgdA/CDA1 family)